MIKKIKRDEKDFPYMIKFFAPETECIYYEGNLELLEMPAVSVVGSRKCTIYGKTVAKEIGGRAAVNDVCVISGLARGIDTAAHTGCLDKRGKTIAVLGGGIDTYYPKENMSLQKKIADDGLLISLNPPGYIAQKYDFPIRNRIISALGKSVVVVEAAIRSGALITCECAVEMGKDVYAVPGNITSHYSFGCNQLIRETAIPLICIDDLFTDLGITTKLDKEYCQSLGGDESRIFNLLKTRGEVTIDEIVRYTLMKPDEVSAILTILEMKGLVFSALGKFFVAKF